MDEGPQHASRTDRRTPPQPEINPTQRYPPHERTYTGVEKQSFRFASENSEADPVERSSSARAAEAILFKGKRPNEQPRNASSHDCGSFVRFHLLNATDTKTVAPFTRPVKLYTVWRPMKRKRPIHRTVRRSDYSPGFKPDFASRLHSIAPNLLRTVRFLRRLKDDEVRIKGLDSQAGSRLSVQLSAKRPRKPSRVTLASVEPPISWFYHGGRASADVAARSNPGAVPGSPAPHR